TIAAPPPGDPDRPVRPPRRPSVFPTKPPVRGDPEFPTPPPVRLRPDLIVPAVRPLPAPGRPVTVEVTVTNEGRGPSRPALVVLASASRAWPSVRGDVRALGPGESAVVPVTIGAALAPGTYSFVARVAPLREEIDRENNSRTGEFVIAPLQQPDLI